MYTKHTYYIFHHVLRIAYTNKSLIVISGLFVCMYAAAQGLRNTVLAYYTWSRIWIHFYSVLPLFWYYSA